MWTGDRDDKVTPEMRIKRGEISAPAAASQSKAGSGQGAGLVSRAAN